MNDIEHVTQAEFARRLRVVRSRVSAMVKDGLPIGEGGLIDIESGMRWVKENVESRRGGANPTKDEGRAVDLVEARRLKIIAETQLTNLHVAQTSGAMVNKDEVRRGLTAFARLQRDKWTNFPNRYGQQIAAAVGADAKLVMATLDQFVRLQLEEIANTKAILPE